MLAAIFASVMSIASMSAAAATPATPQPADAPAAADPGVDATRSWFVCAGVAGIGGPVDVFGPALVVGQEWGRLSLEARMSRSLSSSPGFSAFAVQTRSRGVVQATAGLGFASYQETYTYVTTRGRQWSVPYLYGDIEFDTTRSELETGRRMAVLPFMEAGARWDHERLTVRATGLAGFDDSGVALGGQLNVGVLVPSGQRARRRRGRAEADQG